MIPALNEETNLPHVLEGLPRVDEVVIVDGGSADDTVAVAREVRPDAVVVRQTRTGKGNALICGFAASRGDIVVTLNADGSTDPGEIPRYVDALISGAEVAHGSRYRDGGGNLVGHRLDRFGNALLSRLVNALFGTRFTDLGYGYNAYWRVLLPVLDLPGVDVPGLRRGQRLWGDGPEIEPMINIRVAAQGMRVVEVASIGYPPIHGVRERRVTRRAVRAVRAALAEYGRRWRIGRQPTVAGAVPRHGTGISPAPHLRFAPQPAPGLRAGDSGSHQRFTDTGSQPRITDTGSHPRFTDSGSHQRFSDTGSQPRITDTGSHPRFTDSGSHQRFTDTGSQPRIGDTGSRQRPGDTGSRLRSGDTGSHQRDLGADTGSHLRSVGGGGPGEETVRRPARPRRGDRPSRGETTDPGQADWRTTTGSGRRPDWREITDTGQWKDLTGAARQDQPTGPRYDPAAAEQQPQHDLDPAARRSLPMYPDPSWTETSGRHAAFGDGPAERRSPRRSRRPEPNEPEAEPERDDRPGAPDRRRYRSAGGRAPWEGSSTDSGSHHRIEPDGEAGPRGSTASGPSGSGPIGDGRGGDGRSGGPSGLGPTGLGETGLGDKRGWARADIGETTDRDVGGRRQRLASWERRAEGRPDLTVITGEGQEMADPKRPGHLRAVPGEHYPR